MKTILCVQVIKTFLVFCYWGTVFDDTVSDRGKDVIIPELIEKQQCCVSNVDDKYSQKPLASDFALLTVDS